MVAIVSVPIFLIALSIETLLFDAAFYASGQRQHAIGRTTEFNEAQLAPINGAIVAFFGSNESLIASLGAAGAPVDVFNEREIGHMNDVREIVRRVSQAKWLSLVTLGLIFFARVFFRRRDGLVWIGRLEAIGAGLTIGLIAAFGLLAAVDFESLFLRFHLLSFDNDMWLLDPRTDNLIRIFPFGFWFESAVTVAVRAVLFALVVGIGGFAVSRARIGAAR
ncbi:MAG: TIGR01906 family membrane protein [Chloroflexota bacterium]|nr:MAG: TIGR01906 family membrane protein [Chloroflexota bacterium]